MSDPDGAAYQRHHRATGENIRLREPDEVADDEDMMEIRMPIATTGEVRNDGDDPLTRDELNGMARQLKERSIGVFPAHGNGDMVAFGRYSPFEKLGEWADAAIESRDEENVLLATARMPDPETLAAATGDYREALAILKEQAKRGIAQDASIGWRDDDSFPGGVDLMEASIVGIGADWRTNSDDEAAEVVAREAVEAGADPNALVERVRAAVTGTDTEATHDMTDDDTETETDEEQDADADGETDGERSDAPEWAARMLDLLENLNDAIREDDDDEDDDEDEEEDGDTDEENEGDGKDEDEDDDEEDDDRDASDASDDEQDADADELAERVAELESALEGVRNGDTDINTPDADTDEEQDADADESDDTDTDRDTESPTEGLGDYR